MRWGKIEHKDLGGTLATEIIEKLVDFSSSRVSHFQFWAKCNGPFVHISPRVDQSVVGISVII